MKFLGELRNNIPYVILKEFTGEQLSWKSLRAINSLVHAETKAAEKAFRVIIGDFVTTEDGTGIVHIAPTFGADDARVAKENGVPPMLVKDENDNLVPLGRLTRENLSKENNVPGNYSQENILKTNITMKELHPKNLGM